MARKVITITSCENCRFVWLYLGLDECCLLLNKKRIPLDDDNEIPSWCPLKDAPQEIIELENKIIIDAGLQLE